MTIKRGLILEGGAMRGMFTCGVTDVLMKNQINFDGAAGISAGAVFGCNIKSGQAERAIRYNKNYCQDSRYCSIKSLLQTGDLYGADFCYRIIPDILDPFDREAFKSNPMEFYVGATDVMTGKAVYHRCTDGGPADISWMRASASMPFVSKPVSIDGQLLLDGGIVNSVPYAFMEHIGYNRNLIILTRPKGYRKKKNKLSPLIKLMLHKYPALTNAVVNRHIMYNRQMDDIDKRELSGKSLVIRPPESLAINRIEKNPDELERVYQIGCLEAEKMLPKIKSFLA